MPGEWSAGRINPPESCRDRRPWRRGVPVWSSRFFQYADLLHCGRPRGGAPTISLPHYADLVYFAGAHVGAPLQSRYRIMRIWCILRAPTWGRPYNLVTALCGFGVFCGRPHRGAPTISLPHYADLVYFAGAHVGAPLQPCYRIMRIWCILRAAT